ncbi:ornithine cyclodeaminase family protein [Peptacetobacter sp.]|uniref:ornithine cyclodeaminase family protein n=1 Tax=Peptacetobacter sp. TaxID=2991975 RepID=UPI00263A0466|nr:ornithine cyclodeaminase family protein [Peptacetobacter sp.]
MLLLNKEDIKKVFTMKDAIEADKKAYQSFCENDAIVPIRTNIGTERAGESMLFMPGYVKSLESAGVKIVSVFPENAKKGKPVVPATVILMDATTGEVISILDGTYITRVRTGAASGAAIDLLAKKDSKIGALIGTGGQAPAQLEAMLAARDFEEVRVYSRNKEKREKFAEDMDAELKSYGTKIIASQSSEEAISDADVIVLATTSQVPVIDGNLVKNGALISGVGSYMPNMHEIDEISIKRSSKIFCDSVDAVLEEAGCIITPLKKGIITKESLNKELGDVVSGKIPGRESDDEIIIFKSVGIGVQDVVTAKMIYDRAVEKNIGTNWE